MSPVPYFLSSVNVLDVSSLLHLHIEKICVCVLCWTAVIKTHEMESILYDCCDIGLSAV